MAKVGSGTFTLSGTGDNVALGLDANGGTTVLAKQLSPNVHAVAALTIDSGVVQLDGTGGNQIWDGGSVTVNGGTFDFKGNNETFTNLNFGVSTTAQPTVAINGGQLSLLGSISYAGGTTGLAAVVTDGNTTGGSVQLPAGGSTASLTGGAAGGSGLAINVPIVGTGGITKTGSATLTLGAANTFSGPTVVNGGTVSVNNVNALQNSVVTVNVDQGVAPGGGVTGVTMNAWRAAGRSTSAAPI